MPQLLQSVVYASVPIWVIQNGVLVFVNAAANRLLYEDTGLSLQGLDLMRFVSPQDSEQVTDLLERSSEAREQVTPVHFSALDARGEGIEVVGAMIPIDWEGMGATVLVGLPVPQARKSRSASGRATGLEALSQRERQVALLVAQGLAVPKIAEQLHIQRETVRTHIKAVYRKTRAHTRVDLTRMVLGVRQGSARKAARSPR